MACVVSLKTNVWLPTCPLVVDDGIAAAAVGATHSSRSNIARPESRSVKLLTLRQRGTGSDVPAATTKAFKPSLPAYGHPHAHPCDLGTPAPALVVLPLLLQASMTTASPCDGNADNGRGTSLRPCTPVASCDTLINSGFVKIAMASADALVGSKPAISGPTSL